MRINQVRVSEDIAFFGGHLRRKFGLKPYADRLEPAVFYGCYRTEDVEALARHKGFRVLVWGGSDAMRLRTLEAVKKLPVSRANPLFQIAPSSFIERDLDRAGMPGWLRLNIFPVDEGPFQPVPLGKKVYWYLGSTTESRLAFYGEPYLRALEKTLPDVEFLVQTLQPATSPHAEMPKIYADCAIGVRMVPHDAGSCTVVEMGLMGRKVVWNGSFPNAIGYRSLEDVARAIKAEVDRAGEIDHALAREVRAALADECWLETAWYHPEKLRAAGE